MREHYGWWVSVLFIGMTTIASALVPDPAGQQAAGIVAGIQSCTGGKLIFNEKTGRLEVRDENGNLLDELATGTAGKVVNVAGQEYLLSFGKDDMGRKNVLVRAGPTMQKPVTVVVLGRKAVLSSGASLLAILDSKEKICYEPSICGQVYTIDGEGVKSEATKLTRGH
ncbi:MAG: hypothetical protein NTZ01_03680 [Verrucomicrobia bacterium]|nr:hypothetical protein [Verrucomicrobiota bacterium]